MKSRSEIFKSRFRTVSMKPWGRPLMKCIEISVHILFWIESGCRSPRGATDSILFCWHVSQAAIYRLMSHFIHFHQKCRRVPLLVLRYPSCPPSLESWICCKITTFLLEVGARTNHPLLRLVAHCQLQSMVRQGIQPAIHFKFAWYKDYSQLPQ